MKKIFILTAVAAVMATSMAVYAASSADDGIMANQQAKSKIAVADNKTAAETITPSDAQEKAAQLEYKKTSFVFQDSGETIVTEMWMDPETLENRTDEIVTSAGGKVEKNYTYYTNEGAKHHINIFRDENGKAVRGEEFYYSQERADTNADDLRNFETFTGRKEMYQDLSFWKDKGTVTSEGKTLRKLLCGNEKEGNTTCVYIDESTGYPVKEEAFVNGKLHSTMTYEFKYVDRDEKLFDASGEGVKLEQLDMEQLNDFSKIQLKTRSK